VVGLQLSLFQNPLEALREQILALDLDHLTPMAALQALYALKQQVGGGKTKKDAASPPEAVKPDGK
jgi:DNA mismatch repair protein MutS